MSFNGSGTFNINSTGQPVVTGTVISSSVFNALTADLATGLSTCITKDGQTTVTANIPMNSFKFTNLAAGTAAGDSVRVSQLQAGSATSLTVTGTNTYAATASPALTAYTTGNTFSFVVPNSNTSSCTLNIDSLGAKAITRDGTTALVSGDLVAGSEVLVVYDGTQFQVVNSNSKTNFTVSNNLTLSNGTTTQVQYLNGSKVMTGSANMTFDGTTLTAAGLSTGGSLTLSGGTANGVLYLNGSKVATSGSALVFDGTNLAIGTGTATNLLTLLATSTPGIDFLNGAGTKRGVISASSSALNFNSLTSNPITWQIDSSEQMRLTSTGLGIGTSSPAYKLDVDSTAGTVVSLNSTSANGPGLRFTRSGTANGYVGSAKYIVGGALADFGIDVSGANNLIFGTNDVERARIDSSGNLLVGTTTGNTSTLTVATADGSAPANGAGSNALRLRSTATAAVGAGPSLIFEGQTGNSTAQYGFAAIQGFKGSSTASDYSGALAFYTQNSGGSAVLTERARIDNSGNLLVGTTNNDPTFNRTNGVVLRAAGNVLSRSSSGCDFGISSSSGTNISFYTDNGSARVAAGTITSNSNSTAYNTSSDYRLKDNQQPLTGSGAFIDALKPKTWEWKSNGSKGVGFIAHEVQEVSPGTVVGEKDAVDEDGNPVMQAMSYGSAEFIANIIAELQSLRARVAELEVKA